MATQDTRLFIAKPFFYFDQTGRCAFPTPDLIRSNARRGIVTALVLDANVCLNLANFARGQKDPEIESMVRQFLLAVEFVKVDVVPYFGCLELASTPGIDQLDKVKLSSFVANVSSALAQSEDTLAWGNLTRFSANEGQGAESEPSLGFFPMLYYFYGCFLKIFEILARGYPKARAVKNLIEFFDWCESTGCQVGLILQAAFALFGGATEAAKLLVLKKDKTPLDVAWGAAWDMWYSWEIQSHRPMTPIAGVQQHAIFVTDDAAAAFVACQCEPLAAFVNEGKPFLSASAINNDFPFFVDKRERLEAQLNARKFAYQINAINRFVSGEDVDHEAIQVEIERLEQSVMKQWGASKPSPGGHHGTHIK
jgi:hypothetical protein